MNGSVAFCFVRDVETEQLLGVYATHPAVSSVQQQACSAAKGHVNNEECVHVSSQPNSGLDKRQAVKAVHPIRASTLQGCLNTLTTEAARRHLCSGGLQRGEPSLDNMSPEAVAFLSALFAEDARGSNSCSTRPAQAQADDEKVPRASSQILLGSESVQYSCPRNSTAEPFDVRLDQLQGGNSTKEPKAEKPDDGVARQAAPFPPPELIAVSPSSLVGFLVQDLRNGSGAYCYDPATGKLLPLQKGLSQTSQSGGLRDSLPSATGMSFLIASCMQDEGARSACAAMAEARVAYVGPGTRRLPSHPTSVPTSASHQGAQPDGTVLGTRLASAESVPLLTAQSDLGLAVAPMRSDVADLPGERPSVDRDGHDDASVDTSDLGLAVAPMRSDVADLPGERPSVDKDGHDDASVDTSTLHCVHSGTTLGIVFCLNAKRADGQALLEAIARVCAPPMALLLQQQWLRRDRFKRVLQLELHRTVFQETSIPVRMMQRLLALLHSAVGAEAAAFFIADTQNRNFICLGGHKRATGLSLSGNHRLLGEAARQRGKTVIFNFLPQGFNAEYDSRARFESRHAMLVPLLNTQGHVKAVVVLLNKRQCACERMKQAAEEAEKQCACDAHPMETMVSYVMGGQQGGSRNTAMRLGAVMEQIENFVLRDRRMMLLSLRRCASVAVTEPTSTRALSDGGAGQSLGSASSARRVGKALCTPPRRHVSSIPAALGTDVSARGEGKASGQMTACFEGAGKDTVPAGRGSCTSLPAAATAKGDVPADLSRNKYPEQDMRLVHSSSAPLVLYSGLRHSSTGGEEFTSAPQLSDDNASEEALTLRHRRSASLPSLVFSATLQKCTRPFDAIRKQLSLEPYRRLDLDIWRRTADELQLFFFLALEELGVMVKSEKTGLQAFFALIRDAYHTDNPYHNFYHAMHVAQMCWLFLTRYSCRDALTLTEQLGLMLAALAHDVDHPGVNNNSLIEEHHPLAIVYNDKAVLENHHAAFATSAMMKLGLFSRKTISARKSSCPRSSTASSGASLGGRAQGFHVSSAFRAVRQQCEGEYDCAEDEDDHAFYPCFADVRRVLITCILATDMELFRHHHEAMRKRGQMKRSTGEFLNSDEDHTLLVTCLIHCADISNPLLPERRNVQWASLIIQEFNAQVEMERHKGLPVTVFMDARTELLRTQSQIGFLSFVVLDQFRALADLVPGAEELVIQGEKNLEDWQAAMDILREAERRDALGESVSSLDLPRNFTFRLKNLSFIGMNGPKCFGHLRSDKPDDWRPQSLDT
ncbi:3', 5'-cyclic nucleotide phosphodiesterase domain-containing protein, putative [Eimeria praecox]|uniref:3', 5'-cyclic nucleotide phosphodiesterase domain-containing protein, putative n=1 Tax=Eimeria praecox TaxID=51316 RepID=U6GZC3_9EIME|nr:3', 5'-cyclic nucleotide phosphodiesterase domain-containing protein, putative [Eimeria praecox]